MTNDPKSTQILISDRDTGLPYSKGLMASQVMVTGLSPVRAYQVAEAVEERLRELGVPSISSAQLGELALEVLEEIAGERYARNFMRWREVEALDVPLVVLIGGATGVGKSTIATQLATRLGIVRVVATDAIREVMRALFSLELMPTLHSSSFTSSKGKDASRPALLTTMSRRPNRFTVSAMNRSGSPCCWMSTAMACTSAPVAERIAAAVCWSRSSRRAQNATLAPSCASLSTVALPTPSLPPVTAATLPFNPNSICFSP